VVSRYLWHVLGVIVGVSVVARRDRQCRGGVRHAAASLSEALLSSLPRAAGEERPRIRLTGEIPSHANPPSGCVFHTRCPRYTGGICKNEEPDFKGVEPGHFWRCHYSADELGNLQRVASDRKHTA
jgi:oligopeptide/dipeptide ABC transporter ATP-binding protein